MSDLLTTRAWSAVERDDLTDALVTVRSLREREKSRSSGCEVVENRPDSGAASDHTGGARGRRRQSVPDCSWAISPFER